MFFDLFIPTLFLYQLAFGIVNPKSRLDKKKVKALK